MRSLLKNLLTNLSLIRLDRLLEAKLPETLLEAPLDTISHLKNTQNKLDLAHLEDLHGLIQPGRHFEHFVNLHGLVLLESRLNLTRFLKNLHAYQVMQVMDLQGNSHQPLAHMVHRHLSIVHLKELPL